MTQGSGPTPEESGWKAVSMTKVVAGNIRRLRTQRGWTQDELRQRLNDIGHRASRPTVAAYESGARSIEVSDLFALGLALGVAPQLLLYPPAGQTVFVHPEPDPRYRDYAAYEVADWLWDPDGHEQSTARVSEWTMWFESAEMGARVSPEDLKELSRKVRRGEDHLEGGDE
jgi:transcriptional regulator with XRE-family HTH domain